ncbi:hypothetical protein [Blastococcus sp. Marseille-P5729]|uniref:hypothetical protein n=1 Tax=Blastococcus sp. Marseille-P5729 TaxID=2086582 RepID=UPI000D0FAFED|nr:hypothetical protein [Blastococcus sp. Marseille-P5729]
MRSTLAPRSSAARLATTIVATLALLLLARGPAIADPATEADAAGAAFGNGEHVYVSPESGQQVDVAAVTGEIGEDPLYIAVVAPNTPPADVLTQLQNSLQQKGTFVVVSGTEQIAQSNVICSDRAQPLLDEAAEEQADTRSGGDLSAFLLAYVDKVADAPDANDADCADAEGGGSGFGSAIPWILGALLIGAGGGYLWLRNRQKARSTRHAARREEVTGALDALARDIDTVGEGGGPHVQHALSDARERHIAAADILADADSDADFDAAMRATREGTHAAHYARKRAGLPTSAPREVERARGERAGSQRAVVIGDQTVQVYPDYRPGAQYFSPGGRDFPAGWYTAQIDEGELLGSITEDD